jgi:hypothetical protein
MRCKIHFRDFKQFSFTKKFIMLKFKYILIIWKI